MKIVVGGYAQGKLDYVLRRYGALETQVWESQVPDEAQLLERRQGKQERKQETVVIHGFHHWVRERIAQGGCPEQEIRRFVEACPDCVIISDEIGNGIVPLEAFEREYRERTGRLLVELAAQAEEVERVICGMGQRIK